MLLNIYILRIKPDFGFCSQNTGENRRGNQIVVTMQERYFCIKKAEIEGKNMRKDNNILEEATNETALLSPSSPNPRIWVSNQS